MEIRIDHCPECGEPLNWSFDPLVDGGFCKRCGNIYYPIEERDYKSLHDDKTGFDLDDEECVFEED